MKTFAELSEEMELAVEAQQELDENLAELGEGRSAYMPRMGGKSGQIKKAKIASEVASSAPVSDSAGKKTVRRGGKGPKPNFMNSISSNDIPSQVTTQKAPSLNTNPKVKYSERDIDDKGVKRWHDGLI